MLACSSAIFGLSLSRFVSAPLAIAVSLFCYLATVRRFIAQMRDEPRPAWITRYVDQPLFAHFGASVFALLATPVCVVLATSQTLASATAVGGGFAPWRAAEGYAYAVGLVLSVWAIWIERRFVRVREISVAIVDLPAQFEGYRILQLSDLHVGSFDPKARALEWVAKSNALEPDLCVVTGDLVTSGSGFYTDVSDAIAALEAKDGVFVSMGNHDQANNDELTRLIEARGPRVLRNASQIIRRGTGALTVAGIDARFASPAEVTRTVKSCPKGVPIVLLSHYPWTFESAAAAGADLVLSGHTHGGQLGIPFISERYNLARLSGQRSRGLVHSGTAALYVNAGLGTTGPPMRLGIPPEIAIITLRRAP